MGYNLDEYQESAVKAEEKNALIVAAPGSGKTTVIINRVNYLVKQKNILDKNIIVITFTKAAALNMKKRYFEKFNTSQIVEFSHKEKAFTDTVKLEKISYDYAFDLNIEV